MKQCKFDVSTDRKIKEANQRVRTAFYLLNQSNVNRYLEYYLPPQPEIRKPGGISGKLPHLSHTNTDTQSLSVTARTAG